MSKVRFGGFVSYTSHLCRALREMGVVCNVYKIRKRTESWERLFGDGIGARNVSMRDALDIVRVSDYAIISATWWNGCSDDISALIENGAEVVIHDHTEYNLEFIQFLKCYGVRPIVIRLASVRNLQRLGLDPVFVPHPYVAWFSQIPIGERPYTAISVCRMDYDKYTHILIDANQLLPPHNRIQLWGTHTRSYMYRKVVGKYAGWTDSKCYTGPCYPRKQQHFPKDVGFAATLNSQAEFSCDMSAIAGDGGGTQYSFLEAMDGGSVLVVNTDWFANTHPDEMVKDENCIAVCDAHELVDLLSGSRRSDYLRVVNNTNDVLASHTPDVVVPQLFRFLEEV